MLGVISECTVGLTWHDQEVFDRVNHDYPTALAAGPQHGDRGLQDSIQWLLEKLPDVGGIPLVLAPGRSNIDGNQLLSAFVKQTGIVVATWRSPARTWNGGPVLAAWPTREKLGEIADDPRTNALCVVPWVKGELDAWVLTADPELLGPAEAPDGIDGLDPVVVEGLKTMTALVNLSNSLSGAADRRDAVAVLQTLNDGGYRLAPDLMYMWALTNGWGARGAERLRSLATDFEAGKRPRLKGTYPLRSGILETWRKTSES